MSDQQTDFEPTEDAAEQGAGEEGGLSALQADLDKMRDQALRGQADLDNYRKRAAREKEDAFRYANMAFLERLIPILDNFELGLSAARGESQGGAIISGLDMVARQFNDFLASSGVEVIDAEGKPFDPHVHEALAQEESAEVADGVVIRQIRKGFKLKDRLIRPANVIVSKGSGKPAE